MREMMMKWCLMSSDVGWHIRDKLWQTPKHGSINLYVHGSPKARQDGQPRTAVECGVYFAGDTSTTAENDETFCSMECVEIKKKKQPCHLQFHQEHKTLQKEINLSKRQKKERRFGSMTDFERFAAALKLVVRLLSVAYGFIKGKVEKAQGLLWVGFALDHHDVLGHSLNQGTCCLCGQQPDGLLDFTGYLHTVCNKPTSVTICRWVGKARKQKYCSCMQHLMLKGLETQTPLQGKQQNFTSVLTLWCILQTFQDKVNNENLLTTLFMHKE